MGVHQFREGNQAADFLIWKGEVGQNLTYEGHQNLPWILKGIIRHDKLGFPRILFF